LKTLVLIYITLFPFLLLSQEVAEVPLVVCNKNEYNSFTAVNLNKLQNLRLADAAKTSNFSVNYANFPNEARVAFQAAVDIWERVLISRVPIVINASWESISSTTLATSGANKVYRNFGGNSVKDVWYPPALAEAILGRNLNDKNHDITININRNISWSFKTDGTREAFKYDLLTVVLHEIAHGIGFTTSFKLGDSNTTQGEWGISGFPIIYDIFVINKNNLKLTDNAKIGNPSTDLKTELTSGNLFFSIDPTPTIKDIPKLYSPSNFRNGGSVSHLDELVFPKGTVNSLMSPQISAAEINHFPGPAILAILNKMGWPVNFFEGSVITAMAPPDITENFIAFPNVANEHFKILIPEKYNGYKAQLILTDLLGNVLQNHHFLIDGFKEVDIHTLPTGTYFSRLLINDKVENFKIIKN